MTTGALCICGLDTVLVAVLAVIIAVVYGELVARLAVRRASSNHARHRAPDGTPRQRDPR